MKENYSGTRKLTVDIPLLTATLLCCAMSVVVLFSVNHSFFTNYDDVYIQIGAVILGIAATLFITILGLERLFRYWYIITAAAAIFVVATFVVGYAPGDSEAQAWISIMPGLSFQPTELYKVVFIATFAMQLNYFKGRINRPIPLLLAVLHIGTIMAVAHLQGDDGAAIVIAVIALGMIIAAGLNVFYILGTFIAAATFFITVGFDMLRPYQQERILGLLDPEAYPDIMFQQTRSVTAIGSGRLYGVGLFDVEHYYVPNSHNDFIFSFIGQSLGLVGMLAAILLLCFIGIRLLILSSRCENNRDRILVIGIFMLIIGQAAINIAMNLALIPVVGIVLPLFSAGGSSMLSCIAAIALASASQQKRVVEADIKETEQQPI